VTQAQTFEYPLRVHFGQIDAAGIVFYPRFFEMINETVEGWFREALGYPFPAMHREHRSGVPTVEARARFLKPVQLEQVVTWTLSVQTLGRSSAQLSVVGKVDGVDHLGAEITLVHVKKASDESIASAPWPPEVRERMRPFLIDPVSVSS